MRKSYQWLHSFWILTYITHTHHLSFVEVWAASLTHIHTKYNTKLHSIVNYKYINSPNEEHSTRNHTRVIAKQKSSDCAQKCQYVNKGRRSRFGLLSNKIFTTSNIIRWLILRRHHYVKNMRLQNLELPKTHYSTLQPHTQLWHNHTLTTIFCHVARSGSVESNRLLKPHNRLVWHRKCVVE